MSDGKEKSDPPSRDRINVHEVYEVWFWTKTLRLSQSGLVAAVKAGGMFSQAVREHLKR